MRSVVRIARWGGLVVAVWLVALVVAGFAFEGATRRGVAERIGESLAAQATIARGELSLVRGSIELEELAVRRSDVIGELSITVGALRCELAPLGLALLDRDCRSLTVRAPRMAASTAALFRLPRPRRAPLRAERVVIDDAQLEVAATALMPSLGRFALTIEHAEAGPTVFKTPLSWLFALRALRASVALPVGGVLELRYADGVLRLAGGVLGAEPVELPLTLPVSELADDAAAEVGKLIALGKDLAERVVARRAIDWVKAKLSP